MKIKYEFVTNVNDVLENVKNNKYLYHGTTIAELYSDSDDILKLCKLSLDISKKISKYFINCYFDKKIMEYGNSKEGKGFCIAVQIFANNINKYSYGDFYLTNEINKAIIYAKNSKTFGELGRLTFSLIKAKEHFNVMTEDKELNDDIEKYKCRIDSYLKLGTDRIIVLFDDISQKELEYESGGVILNNVNPYNSKGYDSYRFKGNLYEHKVKVLKEKEYLQIAKLLEDAKTNFIKYPTY